MGTFLGVPIIRIMIYWGLYWGPPVLGNYHLEHPRSHAITPGIPIVIVLPTSIVNVLTKLP